MEADRFDFGDCHGCFVRLTGLAQLVGFFAMVGMTKQHSALGYWWTVFIFWPITCCWGGLALRIRWRSDSWPTESSVKAYDKQRATQERERKQAESQVLNRTIVFREKFTGARQGVHSVLAWEVRRRVGRPSRRCPKRGRECCCGFPSTRHGALWQARLHP